VTLNLPAVPVVARFRAPLVSNFSWPIGTAGTRIALAMAASISSGVVPGTAAALLAALAISVWLAALAPAVPAAATTMLDAAPA